MKQGTITVHLDDGPLRVVGNAVHVNVRAYSSDFSGSEFNREDVLSMSGYCRRGLANLVYP